MPKSHDTKEGDPQKFNEQPGYESADKLFNVEDYRDDLQGSDYTDEQKEELLRIVWNIMRTFVELGWSVDTVHMVLPQLFSKAAIEFDQDSQNLLESKDTQSGMDEAIEAANNKEKEERNSHD